MVQDRVSIYLIKLINSLRHLSCKLVYEPESTSSDVSRVLLVQHGRNLQDHLRALATFAAPVMAAWPVAVTEADAEFPTPAP